MFWKHKNTETTKAKLPKPQEIPDIVKKQHGTDMIDPNIIQFLKIVTTNSSKGEKTHDFRIFDPAEAEALDLKVENYNSLDQVEELIISEGVYDESSKTATFNLKRNIPKYKLLTQEEILQQIENLKNPGDQVFFYTAAGTGSGGPLGRGATIVKVNPQNTGKKRKIFGMYSTSVSNMKLIPEKEGLVFEADKPKDIAKWIAESHKERFC